jgi:plastocyanin
MLVAFTTIAATAGSLLLGGSRPQSTALRDAPADATVSIRTFQFAPDTLRVKVGTKVSWTNADEIEHTITSGTLDARDGRFNGVVDKRGATYTTVLEKPGTYRYFCDRHRFMNGTVIVNP